MPERAVRVTPELEVTQISYDKHNFLSVMQEAVGGLIERIELPTGITMWLNEEALMSDEAKPNPMATIMHANARKISWLQALLAGSVVFTGVNNHEGIVSGLSDEELAYIDQFYAEVVATISRR